MTSMIPAPRTTIAPIFAPVQGLIARFFALFGLVIMKAADLAVANNLLQHLQKEASDQNESDFKLREVLAAESRRADVATAEARQRFEREGDTKASLVRLLEALEPLGVSPEDSLDKVIETIREKSSSIAILSILSEYGGDDILHAPPKVQEQLMKFIKSMVCNFCLDMLEHGPMGKIDNPLRDGPAPNFVSFYLHTPDGDKKIEVVIQRTDKETPEGQRRRLMEALKPAGVSLSDTTDKAIAKLEGYFENVEYYCATHA